jgi:3-hydroxybutyryl-CoA dehydratase
MEIKDISIDAIKTGETISFKRIFTEKDVEIFAQLSGDMNPLHMNDAYAKTTKFGRRLVHGMLLGSLCSKLVGMYIPGKKCLYLGQTLVFKKPVFIEDTVTVIGKVTSKSLSTRIVKIAISIMKDKEEVANGEAITQILV